VNVLVTGASSGIGAALARMCAARGDTVGIVARRADRLAEVLADCGPEARMWVCDLADTAAAVRVAHEAWDALGGLDALVNNAGVPMRRHTTKLDAATIEWVMRVNFLSPAAMSQAVLPRMLARGSGAIVHVSSVAGRIGNANEAAYSASKFALCGWAEATAVDLWDTPIRIRLVNPGPIDTEIWDLPGNDDPLYDGPKVPAELVASGILAAIEGDRFEVYLPDMKAVVDHKQRDLDGFLAGMAKMLKRNPA
jgi:short-subunit dehydrogenase